MSREIKGNARTLLIGLFTCYGLYVTYFSSALQRRGIATLGIVTSRGSKGSANYSFTVSGRTYEGSDSSSIGVGGTIKILYLPENPAVSAPYGSYPLLRSSLFLGFGILFLIGDIAFRVKEKRSGPKL